MTPEHRAILQLLRKALCPSAALTVPSGVNWKRFIRLAHEQGVLGVCFSAVDSLPAEQRPGFEEMMDWIGRVEFQKKIYEKQRKAVAELSAFYSEHGIRMMLLKGYGLSLNYPTPELRPGGDIDVYLGYDTPLPASPLKEWRGERSEKGKGNDNGCPAGEVADELIKQQGIEVKQNEDKHSTFPWKGITVENHAAFIGDIVHPCLDAVEQFLEEQASCAVPHAMQLPDGKSVEVFLPSPTANAVFLPLHTGVHFFHGEASLRQLCDWATYVQAHSAEIDWDKAEAIAKRAGYYPFFRCLNGICISYLGFPAELFPQWERSENLEAKVLAEILRPRLLEEPSLPGKVVRFFRGHWKYRMLFRESILLASFRQARAYLNTKGIVKGQSIWTLRKR